MRTASVLIPVKSPTAAKSRLSPLLAADQRTLLQGAMLEDMIAKLQLAHLTSTIALYGPAAATAEIARRYSVAFLPQSPLVHGLNEAVADGCARLADDDADLILVLPGDLPLITAEEVDRAIVTAVETRKRLVVPDRWQRGTNGIVFAAREAPDFCFGPNSFRAHLSQDEMLPVFLPSLAFDIDTPDDLWPAMGTSFGKAGPKTYALLMLWRIAAKSDCCMQEIKA